jgi:chorismate mutase
VSMTETATDGPPITDVAAGRARIDAIDAAIRDLVASRVATSHQVQALRRAEGRPGIQHARENEIIGSYVDVLGDPGADIALAVLALCRGRVG